MSLFLAVLLSLHSAVAMTADEIEIRVVRLSGEHVLTEPGPVRVSDLKGRLHAQLLDQDPELLYIQIALSGSSGILDDTEDIIESAVLNLIINQVEKIANSRNTAWAFLAAGKVICKGIELQGGRAPEGLEGVKEVVANIASFAALKYDGSVTAWGYRSWGGRAPEEGLAEGVEKVVPSCFAFAALKSDGSVLTWGAKPEVPPPAGDLAEGVKEVVATYQAFAALKYNGSVTAWGRETCGGRAPAEGLAEGVEKVIATRGAFAALKSDGSVIFWGDECRGEEAPAKGLATGVQKVVATNGAFAALKSDGNIITWGDISLGGRVPAEARSGGVKEVVAARYAFAALKSDGNIIAWGDTHKHKNEARMLLQERT